MHLLDIQHVTKDYAGHRALDDVSFAVPQGSILGLLGPNGAGKTSLIRIVTQITRPDNGQILFEGEPLAAEHVNRIGYLPEERGLYRKMRVGEQLIYLARLRGLSRPEAVRTLKEWVVRFEMQDWWKKNVEELSKGMQQKIQFIATVAHNPPLLILDEPFSGFDPINANLIRDEILRLRAAGSTIIFSTHRMESVEDLCDYIVLIDKSRKVLEGPKREVRHRYRTNTYRVEGVGALGPLPPDLELVGHEPTDGDFTARICAPHEDTANRIVAALLDQQVGIRSVQEEIPSIQDIFIAKVQGKEALPA